MQRSTIGFLALASGSLLGAWAATRPSPVQHVHARPEVARDSVPASTLDLPPSVVDAIGRNLYLSLPPERRAQLVRMADRGAQRPVNFSVCFAPDTPDEVVHAFNQIQDAFAERFNAAARWGTTVLDPGSAGARGEPTTLTYSFLPDGTNTPGEAGEPDAPSDLFAYLNGIYGSPATWQALYGQVLNRWSQLSGLSYVFEPNDDGASFPDSPGVAGVRGDMRFGGHPIDGGSGILAYNYFPQLGDMIIDTDDTFYTNTSNSSLRLRNVLAHEHGHGMGVRHVCPVEQTKLMEPFVSTIYDGPRHDDIRVAHFHYGDINEPDNSVAQATSLGSIAFGGNATAGSVPAPAVTLGSTISIDEGGEQDWFTVTASQAGVLIVTVTPIGTSYLDGPQSCPENSGSCCPGEITDSAAVADLAVEVRDAAGNTVLASATSAGSGAVEVAGVAATAGTTYSIRVFETAFDDVQLYSLSATIGNAALLVSTPAGTPSLVSPTASTSFPVQISALGQTVTSASLFYRSGTSGTFSSVPLTPVSGIDYLASIPAMPCGPIVQFYVQASGSAGGTTSQPAGAPASLFSASVGTLVVAFSDTFESDQGWTATATATSGLWERGDPVGTAAQPEDDSADAGTLCFFTGQGAVGGAIGANDIDGGAVVLTSPAINLAGASGVGVSYQRWFSNNAGSAPNQDIMVIEISSDNGATWTTLETLGPTTNNNAGWVASSFNLATQFPSFTPSANVRLRFTASDTGSGSIVEAAIDDVVFTALSCVSPPACVADVDDGTGTGTPDGGVTIDDLIYYLGLFDAGNIGADVDDGTATGTPDGGVTIDDLIYFLARFDLGC